MVLGIIIGVVIGANFGFVLFAIFAAKSKSK